MNRYAGLCAGAIRALLVRFRSDAPAREPADRQALVGAVHQALARRSRRSAWRPQLHRAGVLAAAGAVVLIAGWVLSGRVSLVPAPPFPSEGEGRLVLGTRAGRSMTVLESGNPDGDRVSDGAVVLAAGAGRQRLARGMTLVSGTDLVAPVAGEVRIGTTEGTTLTLEKGGRLTVLEQSSAQRFALRGGAVRVQVAKLRPLERFLITTDDAEVEVHGTVFRVATVPGDPTCGNGVRTRVSVFEGVVSVRVGGAETSVPAGAEWPEGCPTPAGISAAQAVAPRTFSGVVMRADHARRSVSSAPAVVGAVAGRKAFVAAGRSASAGTSALTVQNDLFAAAIRAKQQKRFSDAIRVFSRLVETYPDGPLTEGAMAQRMTLLVTVDAAGANRAAFEYLERFPAGFAHAEARRVAGSAPRSPAP